MRFWGFFGFVVWFGFGLWWCVFLVFFPFPLTVGWIIDSQNSGLDPARLHNISQLLWYFVMQMLADFTKTFFFIFLICWIQFSKWEPEVLGVYIYVYVFFHMISSTPLPTLPQSFIADLGYETYQKTSAVWISVWSLNEFLEREQILLIEVSRGEFSVLLVYSLFVLERESKTL